MTNQERNSYVEENINIVHSRIAQLEPQAYKNGDYYDDLFQSGMVGFIEGLNHYNEQKGENILSYCVYWIDCRIKKFKRENRMIQIPAAQYPKVIQYKTLKETYGLLDNEIKVKMNLTDKQLKLMIQVSKYVMTNETDGNNVEDNNKEHYPEHRIIKEESRKLLKKSLEKLKYDEKILITELFGYNESEEKNMSKLGKERNMTRQAIRQKRNSILNKLKLELQKEI